MGVLRETELFEPLRRWFEEQGYTVRAEVKHCDVVARRGEAIAIVEMKRVLNLDLLIQATRRQQITDSVYVAIPRAAQPKERSRLRGVRRLLRQLELGLLLVDPEAGTVELAVQPLPCERRKRAASRRAIVRETDGRSANHNLGGSTGKPLMTAWRENALLIAAALDLFGATSPARLRELGTGPKTQSILGSRMNYGWFARVERGIYDLTPKGRAALIEYAEVTGPLRQRLVSG